MIKIDNGLLQDIGLGGLPAHEKDSLLKHIYETLEMRVGMRLADQMSNQQLDEFEQYFEAKDDAGAFKWLETNFPNYKDVVQEEFDKLKAEVQAAAPQILAAASQPHPAAPAMPAVDPAAPVDWQQPPQAPAPQGPAAPGAGGFPGVQPPQPPFPPQPPVDPNDPGQQQPPAGPSPYEQP